MKRKVQPAANRNPGAATSEREARRAALREAKREAESERTATRESGENRVLSHTTNRPSAPISPEKGAPKTRRAMRWGRWLSPAILLGCLFFGLACRFYGLNWDQGAQLHPDERFCIGVAEKLRFPASIAEFFDSRVSPLSPANLPDTHYIYGQLPLFALKIAARISGREQTTELLMLGRLLSALFDCGTVWWTFLAARRLLDAQKALFCAALVSCAALHIQQSHFFVVDPFAACFLAASFWAGVRLVQQNRARDAILVGAFFGAALACKISAALFGVALVGFLLLLARANPARRTLGFALLTVLAMGITFRLGQPMAFRGEFGFFDVRPEIHFEAEPEADPKSLPLTLFWNDLAAQSGITSGQVDVPFDVQWIGRAPLVYSLRNLGFWGYGWPFLLSSGAGILLLALRPRGKALLVVAAFFALVLLGIQGTAFSKFTRYFLPLTPFCAFLAAHAWRELESRKWFFGFGAPIIALSAAVWSWCVTSIYARPHSRIAASHWIEEHIAPGTRVANETAWDDGLPLGSIGVANNLESLDLGVYEPESREKIAALAARLDQVEWIFISSGRGWQSIPRWSEKWPITTEYYRALFDGRLGFQLEQRFTSFPSLGAWQFPDASAEEALTVYDHPMVMLFHKTKNYDPAQTRQILNRIAPPEPQDWHPNLAAKPDESALPVPPGF